MTETSGASIEPDIHEAHKLIERSRGNILEGDGTFYTLTHVMTKHGFESRATGGHYNSVDLYRGHYNDIELQNNEQEPTDPI